MLATKTVCRPGSFVEAVPDGLLATLRYNQHGLLEQIAFGFGDDAPLADSNQLAHLAGFVPNTIAVTGGTTWVEGVFYAEDCLETIGTLPEDLKDPILNCDHLAFYAGNARSLAVSLNGANPVRNWLTVSKFDVLPGMVVPVNFTEDSLQALLTAGGGRLKYPYLAGFIVFDMNDVHFDRIDLFQAKVRSTSRKLSPYGYVTAEVKFSADSPIKNTVLNWSEVVTWNMQSETAVLLTTDEVPEVLGAFKTDERYRTPVSPTLTCPICNKIYNVVAHGPVCCDDPNCISRLYPVIQHMLSVFELPPMSEERFIEISTKKEILCLTDVLLLDEYKGHELKTTLATAIYAVTPPEICADKVFFSKFADACNNSAETLLYYVSNPARIQVDFELYSIQAQRFCEWLKDFNSAQTVQSILSMVKILIRTKKYDGRPIFRNVVIAVTGQFRRGNYDTIVSILESYSAKVTPAIESETPNVLVIGSLNSNIDGSMIHKARLLGVPMMSEDDFFAKYEIDSDLADANLL